MSTTPVNRSVEEQLGTSSEKIVEVVEEYSEGRQERQDTKSEETVEVLKPAMKVTGHACGEFSGNP